MDVDLVEHVDLNVVWLVAFALWTIIVAVLLVFCTQALLKMLSQKFNFRVLVEFLGVCRCRYIF